MNFSSQKQEDGTRQTFNEINITPLTDIFLVLLIIMMVIAPSFQSVNGDIKMPEINSGLSVEQKEAVVSITKDGAFYVGETNVNPDNLETYLSDLISNTQAKEVVVKADKETKSSEIMKVMQAAQNAGYTKLVVAGEPLSKKQQRDLEENSNVNVPSENDFENEVQG